MSLPLDDATRPICYACRDQIERPAVVCGKCGNSICGECVLDDELVKKKCWLCLPAPGKTKKQR
jgi:hypothetical protein